MYLQIMYKNSFYVNSYTDGSNLKLQGHVQHV
jgi:hypothetical protein